MQSLVLEDGIKGWVSGGKEYTDMIDGFDEGQWVES